MTVLMLLLPFIVWKLVRRVPRLLTYVDDVLESIAAIAVIRAFWPNRRKKLRGAREPVGQAFRLAGLVFAGALLWFGPLVPWKVVGGLFVAWYVQDASRRREKLLAGEPDTDQGKRRADEKRVVALAIRQALDILFNGAPSPLGAGRVTVRQGGRDREIGFYLDVRTAGRVTVNDLRSKAGQVFARGDDAIAATVNEVLPELWPRKRLGKPPVFIGSYVEMATREDGQEIPGRARVSLLTDDPFAVVHPVPYRPNLRYVRDLTKGVPIGVRVGGGEVLMEVWHRHTEVTGQSRWGKSSLLHAALYALAAERDVAFVLADLKGTDMNAWAERASCSVHGTAETQAMLRSVEKEMRRRVEILRRSGAVKVVRPTIALPLLLVVVDEAQDLIEQVSPDEAEENERLLKAIAKKGAALGVTLILSSQQVKAKLLDTDVTSQLNQVSAKQQTLSSAAVAVGQHRATKTFGPHLIPGNRERYAGVIAGAFADSHTDEYVRVYHVGGEGRLARARARACRARRVPLDWLDVAAPAADPEPDLGALSAPWHGFHRQPIVVDDLPATIVARLESLSSVLDRELPAHSWKTKRSLSTSLLNPAVTEAANNPALAALLPSLKAWRDDVLLYVAEGVVPGPIQREETFSGSQP